MGQQDLAYQLSVARTGDESVIVQGAVEGLAAASPVLDHRLADILEPDGLTEHGAAAGVQR